MQLTHIKQLTGALILKTGRHIGAGEDGFLRYTEQSPDRYLAIYQTVVGRNHPSLEKARRAVKNGLEPSQFEQNRSKINRRLAASLSLAAGPYKVCSQGRRSFTRYGIALPPDRIFIKG